MLTDQELNEIARRADAATAPPWKASIEGRDHTSGSSFIMTGSADTRGPDLEIEGATEADYDFIASSRQDVPRLLAEVQLLRSLLGEAQRRGTPRPGDPERP